jgi:arylformamidase
MPPVNYDEHILRAHSLTHLETPAHTQSEGRRIESFFDGDLKHFFGKVLVLRLTGNHYRPLGNGNYHWEITVDQIKSRLDSLKLTSLPSKVFITTENYPENAEGYHDPNFVLTLSQEAADYLVSSDSFDLYGTSWKSSDYNPGKMERPIHNTLFKKALILENLCLQKVPEGQYFLNAFPLPLVGASESPIVPVLFTKEEILNCL